MEIGVEKENVIIGCQRIADGIEEPISQQSDEGPSWVFERDKGDVLGGRDILRVRENKKMLGDVWGKILQAACVKLIPENGVASRGNVEYRDFHDTFQKPRNTRNTRKLDFLIFRVFRVFRGLYYAWGGGGGAATPFGLEPY